MERNDAEPHSPHVHVGKSCAQSTLFCPRLLSSSPQQSSPKRPALLLQLCWKRGDITKQAILPAFAIPRKLALEETRANSGASSSIPPGSEQVRHISSQVNSAPAVLSFFERAVVRSPPAIAWAIICLLVSRLPMLLHGRLHARRANVPKTNEKAKPITMSRDLQGADRLMAYSIIVSVV